jgi:uncharacterized protein YecE (DUF72 family)
VKDQLSLFGGSSVEPAEDGAARVLAARLPSTIRFGTSSWTFPGWAGIVYAGAPTQEDLVDSGLRAYARHPLFRTVGIDRSHYAPLTAPDLAKYASQLPPGFLAVSKVWEEITTAVYPVHPRFGARAGTRNATFLDPARTEAEVLAPYAEAFLEHSGPFVFEIPPMPRGALSAAALARAVDRLLHALPTRFRYAFELRNPELLTPGYLDVLHAHGAAHVLTFWSGMPALGEQLALPGVLGADFVVARLLLPPGARYEERKAELAPFNRIVTPQPEMRADVVRLARACVAANKALFVLVNNKAEGSSPLTIRALVAAIAQGEAAGGA